jgi:hypothetical protein
MSECLPRFLRLNVTSIGLVTRRKNRQIEPIQPLWPLETRINTYFILYFQLCLFQFFWVQMVFLFHDHLTPP